ncbi:MAG TPA: bifunctional riboflavin kinase/FAD synthetase [Mariprofundaceae bacterium]|nr:bifunctional riboflavin kinase/FAD synthetase [Mariprofundaceae bacterium]
MRIFRHWQDAKTANLYGGAITIGNFDGVHMGHQQILTELRDHALDAKGPAIAVTFDPHPRAVLFPDESPRRLCHLHERLERLEQAGVDAVLLLHFDNALASWTAEKFTRTVYETFQPKHWHVGYDFAFGHDREGSAEKLREIGDELGFTVSEAAAFEMDHAVVSSSRIRSAVESSDFILAEKLLGRPYSISGHVMHGDKRGRKIGFPTANLDVADLAHPPAGIYAVHAKRENDGTIWNGAAYLGFRPTFQGRTMVLETHMLDANPDLYNQRLEIQFVQRVREDRAYKSAEELSEQIARDCAEARSILDADGRR